MPASSDLDRLEQTIAELMARIETLREGLEKSPAGRKTAPQAGGGKPAWGAPAHAPSALPPDLDRVTALRNALKDLGAHMAVLTMLREGASSPIPALLKDTAQAAPAAGMTAMSIAQRIHALCTGAGSLPPAK